MVDIELTVALSQDISNFQNIANLNLNLNINMYIWLLIFKSLIFRFHQPALEVSVWSDQLAKSVSILINFSSGRKQFTVKVNSLNINLHLHYIYNYLLIIDKYLLLTQ